MRKHRVNTTVAAIAIAFMVGPSAAHAAQLAGIFPSTPAPLLVKKTDPIIAASLPVAVTREPRWTTVRAVTAYSSTVDQCDSTPFVTANGTHVHDGIVAANWLPFGTRVRIPEIYGDKIFVVTDRMNVRFSSRMDVWMNAREKAQSFGLHRVTVEIL